MKKLSRMLTKTLLVSSLVLATHANAGIAVIVNKSNSVTSLDNKTASRIFLKKTDSFENGVKATPIELNDPEIKNRFYKAVSRKTETQLRSYWARMVFSGKSQPPTTASSAGEILSMIANDPSAIGFIDEADVNDSVKVVLTIN